MKKAIVALLALSAGLAANAAYDLKVSLWRGESLSVILPDECPDVGASAPGISVEKGTLLPVRYNAGPKSLEYRFVADRAVYGSKEPGIHFATITAAPDAKPGTYALGHLTVTVVDHVLPPAREWKYFLDLWQHPWAVARTSGSVPFSEAHYRAMEPLWKMLAAAGQKTLTVTLVDQPWNHQCYDAYGTMIGRRKGADGKWSFDYSVFDRYVEFGRACGLGPDIACYTMCPWGYMVDYVDADGKAVRVEAKPGTPVFDDYWGDFLVDFSKHLEAKGWLKDTFIAMDERTPEDLAYIAKFVRRIAPGLKIAMAGNRKPSDFKGIVIDNYSQALRYLEGPSFGKEFLAEAAERRKEGKVTTFYVCCSPARPNTFMCSGPGEAFVCGFYSAACGLDGLLRWAYNSWGEDACRDMTYSRWTAGDVALVYPDGSPSWRFLDLKNGIQAAEKFRILKEAGGREQELAALAAKFKIKALLDGTNYQALRKAVDSTLNR
ncbi:MAG: DUF4091 domain-containing protein [Kiritimatiellae bacterium]|nr:DUF4091 domain-containing protein [Kiritimatiellia bacterium]